MKREDVTAAIFCKNEEFWIHYVLKNLLKVVGHVILLDTGSTDSTIEVADRTCKQVGGDLTVYQKDYGNSSHKIGNAPNILRCLVKTHWMLLVGGDEIWPEASLLAMLESDLPTNTEVGMLIGRNVIQVEGVLTQGNQFSADRVFNPNVRWQDTKYPFESHDLEGRIKAQRVTYLNGHEVFYWHVRDLSRSSRDADAYYRLRKVNYFENVSAGPVPADWVNIDPDYANPYFVGEPDEITS